MQNRNVFNLVLVACLVIAAFGCKGKKKVAATETTPKSVNELPTKTVLMNSQSEWTFYTSKADVSIEGAGINRTVDATIKMQKDSIIWISVGLFGIEGARVFMQKDSITVLNKLDKSYSRMGWAEIGAYVGTELNLAKTQSLIVANLLIAPDSNYKLKKDSALYFMERIMENTIYKVRFDSINHQLHYSFFRGEKTGKYLTVNYGNYEVLDKGSFPKTIKLNANDGLKKFDADIKINNINMDAFGVLPTTIPNSFKRL
jgi:hypothetical protein